MRALSQLSDLVILNLLTLLCCVPVVTAGASFAAMHYCLIRMHEGTDGSIPQLFFREFKGNFKKATCSWLLLLAIALVLFIDNRIMGSVTAKIGGLWRGAFFAGIAVASAWALYVFPLHARFENSVTGTWKNAGILALAFLPRTLGMLVIEGVLLFLFTQVTSLLPLFFLLGFSLPGFLRGYLYLPVLKKIAGESGAKAEETEESGMQEETDDGGQGPDAPLD